MELSKPVKIANGIETIEKTKVSLAARIFGEPIRYYVVPSM